MWYKVNSKESLNYNAIGAHEVPILFRIQDNSLETMNQDLIIFDLIVSQDDLPPLYSCQLYVQCSYYL